MKEFKKLLCVPLYLVQGMSSDGVSHAELDDGTVETDDLRLALELSGGHNLLIGIDCRFIVTTKEVIIEGLVDTD